MMNVANTNVESRKHIMDEKYLRLAGDASLTEQTPGTASLQQREGLFCDSAIFDQQPCPGRDCDKSPCTWHCAGNLVWLYVRPQLASARCVHARWGRARRLPPTTAASSAAGASRKRSRKPPILPVISSQCTRKDHSCSLGSAWQSPLGSVKIWIVLHCHSCPIAILGFVSACKQIVPCPQIFYA